MNNKLIPLGREFFARDTNIVSQELLGKVLYFKAKQLLLLKLKAILDKTGSVAFIAQYNNMWYNRAKNRVTCHIEYRIST